MPCGPRNLESPSGLADRGRSTRKPLRAETGRAPAPHREVNRKMYCASLVKEWTKTGTEGRRIASGLDVSRMFSQDHDAADAPPTRSGASRGTARPTGPHSVRIADRNGTIEDRRRRGASPSLGHGRSRTFILGAKRERSGDESLVIQMFRSCFLEMSYQLAEPPRDVAAVERITARPATSASTEAFRNGTSRRTSDVDRKATLRSLGRRRGS